MNTQRISTGAQFHWLDVLYEVKRLLPDKMVNIETVATGAVQVVPLQTLIDAWANGRLVFETISKRSPTRTPPREREAKLAEYADLSDYPPKLVEVARWRLSVIAPLLALEPTQRTKATIQARVDALQAARSDPASSARTLTSIPGWRAVYRWMNNYMNSGNDLRALIPSTRKRGGKGGSRLAAEVDALVDVVIRDHAYSREKVTLRDLLLFTAVRIEEENRLRPAQEKLRLPHRHTLTRRLNALDLRDRFAARHGARETNRQFTQYEQMTYPTLPLERVEIDHTSIDLIVVDEQTNLPFGRLTFTCALDTATRYPLGFYIGFEPPSYYAVMECLNHAILPKGDSQAMYGTAHQWKAYGTPGTLVVDNGREFIGKDLADVGATLGIVIQQSPVKKPWFKAAIERTIRSATGLFHTLPGTTFSNPQQRGDYQSVKQACITLGDLERALNIYIVDIYAESFHRGLNGIPARHWERALENGFSPRLPTSADELRILLGRVKQRTIQHYGIELYNLRYNCPALAPLRHRLKGEPAKLKYHPGDLSRIYVRDPFNDGYIEVPALAQQYTDGLSLWAHRVICEFVRGEQDTVDLAALGRAKLKIQGIVDAARSRKRTNTVRKVARWEASGKPPSLTGRDTAPPAALPTPQPEPPNVSQPAPGAIQPTPPAEAPTVVPAPSEPPNATSASVPEAVAPSSATKPAASSSALQPEPITPALPAPQPTATLGWSLTYRRAVDHAASGAEMDDDANP